MANRFKFDEVIKKLAEQKINVPVKIAEASVYYFLSSWDKQGFGGNSWQEVKRRQSGTKAYKYGTPAARTRGILIGKGVSSLKHAVKDSKVQADWNLIKLVVDLPYAKVHNEGLRAGRGAGFKMPKRQFMGQTAELKDIQMRIIKENMDRIWPV